MKLVQSGLVLVWLVGFASSAGALTIGFDNVGTQNNIPYTGHIEKGFQVTPILGTEWYFSINFGTPKPCVWSGPRGHAVPSALKVARADGGLFEFRSVDLDSEYWATYTIIGYRAGEALYNNSGTHHGLGDWQTVAESRLFQVDTITVGLGPPSGWSGQYAYDSIVVEVVPEPGSLGAVVLACLLVVRRRPRNSK